MQQHDVQQYLSRRSESQASERQRERALLGSDTLQSDKAGVPVCCPSSSRDSSQNAGSSGPYEIPKAYSSSFHEASLKGQSVQPPSNLSADSPPPTTATGSVEKCGSSVSSSKYETLGLGPSITRLPTGCGSIDRSAMTSTREEELWICSYCADEDSPAQEIPWRCSRCGNDQVGLWKRRASSTVARRESD